MLTSEIGSELALLREENERLRRLLESLSPPQGSSDSDGLSVHYVYASPLVLVDNLGTTVLQSLDPLRIETEYRRIYESLASMPSCSTSITVASPANLLQLKHVFDHRSPKRTILHISMHTVDVGSNLRCALEDDYGRGYLMGPDEFCVTLGSLNQVEFVFVNACKSHDIGVSILECSNKVNHVVCLGSSEPVLETAALLFAAEFYSSYTKMSVEEAFDRGKQAVKTCPIQKVSNQSDLFILLSRNDQKRIQDVPPQPSTFALNQTYINSIALAPLRLPKSVPFWIGYISPDFTVSPEDFVGRQSDIVRISSMMFSGSGRRVCAVTGEPGSGKTLFLTEACKYLASPGGRYFGGGVCVVLLPEKPDGSIENTFLEILIMGIQETIKSLRNWYGLDKSNSSSARNPTPTEEDEFDDEVSQEEDSSAEKKLLEKINPPSNAVKSYKVFWADTFSSESDLLEFLDSYQVSLPSDGSFRLFNELRLNGTQLQDWGGGRLMRVVHVVRLLIKGGDNMYLLENREGKYRMLSKKFDPVTENVLEVAGGAVYKELGRTVKGRPIQISKLVLRDRKPGVEINDTSPSYPGLATKYVLYTADVAVTGLPSDENVFETTDAIDMKKIHSWEWFSSESQTLLELLPASDAIKRRNSKVLEMQINGEQQTITLFDHGKPLQKEYAKAVREWASLCENLTKGTAGLILIGADDYLRNPIVRQILGKSLVRHANLKILFTQTSLENKSVLNLTTASVSYKIIHFPLPPLQAMDAAVLFTRRIHRPLYHRDWWVDICPDGAPMPPLSNSLSREGLDDILVEETVPLVMNTKHPRGVANLARLARHPLLQSTGGLPDRILAIAQHVTIELVSINELLNR